MLYFHSRGSARGRSAPSAAGVALAVSLLVAAAGECATTPEQHTYSFASGRQGGNYQKVALALQAELAGGPCRLSVITTEGSYENASLLRSGHADLALLQSDVAYLEHYNRRPFLALAALYTEPIHVVAYRGLGLRRLSDLLPGEEKYTIAFGTPGSGSNANAFAVLDGLGLPTDRLCPKEISIDQAAQGLQDRSIDVAFVTSAVPVGTVVKLAKARIVTLLEIDGDIARQLRHRNPFFVAAEIPYAAYGATNRSVQTLGVRTLLVARPDLPKEAVDALLNGLYAVADKAREAVARAAEKEEERDEGESTEKTDDNAVPFLAGLSPGSAMDELAIPAHPAAADYHHKHRSWVANLLRAIEAHAVPLFLLLLVAALLTRLSRIAFFLHRFVFGRVLAALVALWLAGAAAMHLFEGAENSNFRSFSLSAIAILHYLFSGLESKYPVTTPGNVTAILVLSLGAGVVTLFTATLVTLLVERALNIKTLRAKPLPFLKLSGHTVIAGWSERTKRIIRQLRSPDIDHQPTVVVIAPSAAATAVEDRRSFRDVWVVEGDRTRAKTLARADIATARAALVIDDEHGDAADLSAVSTSRAIERVASDVHVVAEARNATAVEHLGRCHVEEIVNTEALAERLVSQCVVTPGIAQVFDELLSFGERSQEIYFVPVGHHLDGLTFDTIRHRLHPCEAVVIGYRLDAGKGIALNPSREQTSTVLHGGRSRRDSLVVLADSPRAVTSRRAVRTQRRQGMTQEGNTAVIAPGAAVATPVKRHAIRVGLCGWNDETRQIVRQLHQGVISAHWDIQITVICDPAQRTQVAENGCTRKVSFVFGDPTRGEMLDAAGVRDLDTLVILADRSRAAVRFSDHRALMICLAARALHPSLHQVVELVRSENQEHFERLDGVEIVSVEDLAEKLLAQAVISPGISLVYQELLTATEDSNEIYVVPVPDRWLGETFEKVADEVQGLAPPVIALGYRVTPPGGHLPVVVLNPAIEETTTDEGIVDWRQRPFAPGDRLVVMAYEEPSW